MAHTVKTRRHSGDEKERRRGSESVGGAPWGGLVVNLPSTTKKWHTTENNQELVNIFEHRIYIIYIYI